MTPEIPDRQYFKIGEVSKLVGVAPHVLRYWESEFPAIRPRRVHSQQRLYRRVDVELIVVIRSLLHEQGYTIAGARKLLQSPQSPMESHDAALKTLPRPDAAVVVGQIKSELQQMRSLLRKSGEK